MGGGGGGLGVERELEVGLDSDVSSDLPLHWVMVVP